MIWFGVCAAFGMLVAGGAAGNEQLKAELDKWRGKNHAALQRDSSAGTPNSPTAPLRVPKAGGKPLWMADDAPTDSVDPRLADALIFRPELDGKERKSSHWTLNDRGEDNASRGDGGA